MLCRLFKGEIENFNLNTNTNQIFVYKLFTNLNNLEHVHEQIRGNSRAVMMVLSRPGVRSAAKVSRGEVMNIFGWKCAGGGAEQPDKVVAGPVDPAGPGDPGPAR